MALAVCSAGAGLLYLGKFNSTTQRIVDFGNQITEFATGKVLVDIENRDTVGDEPFHAVARFELAKLKSRSRHLERIKLAVTTQ